MTIPPGVPDPVPWSRLVAPGRPRLPGPPQIPPLLEPAPVRYPAAFCAPGTEAIAALILWLNGEEVADIRASRMLEGSGSVIVVTEPPRVILDRESSCILPRDSGPDERAYEWREDLRFRMRMTPPPALPFRLSSVVMP